MKHTQWTMIAALMIISAALSACGTKIQNSSDLESYNDQSIVGGQSVADDEQVAKSIVALGSPLMGNFCTGTLIAKNLVVTATHCIEGQSPRSLVVTFGTTPDKAPAALKRRVLGGSVHPLWETSADAEKDNGDISVLRIEGSAPEGFEPISILGNPEILKDGLDAVLAGFGLLSMKPQVEAERLMKAAVKLTDSKFGKTEIFFAQHEGRGACHGDSGGPAFVQVKGKWVLVGVTSRAPTASGGRSCLEGAIYTSTVGTKDFLVAAAKYLNSDKFVSGRFVYQAL